MTKILFTIVLSVIGMVIAMELVISLYQIKINKLKRRREELIIEREKQLLNLCIIENIIETVAESKISEAIDVASRLMIVTDTYYEVIDQVPNSVIKELKKYNQDIEQYIMDKVRGCIHGKVMWNTEDYMIGGDR